DAIGGFFGGIFGGIGSIFGLKDGGIVPGFAGGGIVSGPIDDGRDRVLIGARAGEGVLTPETTAAVMQELTGRSPSVPSSHGGMQAFAAGGMVAPGGIGGAMNVTIKAEVPGVGPPPDRVSMRRWLRDVLAVELREMRRDGLLAGI
ncbi:MAG: hypothetical protein RL139_1569, partial [Gemmatimonadota bacterium]